MGQEEFPHFRYYLKSGHPVYIVGETDTEYLYHKVMTGPKDGRHKNYTVTPNPDKTRKEPMHIGHRMRRDKKKYFAKSKLP